MEWLAEETAHGVRERRFDLAVDGVTVPGILWTPENSSGTRPLVLIGHGGSQHKRAPNVLSLARRIVRHLGFAAAAIEAVGEEFSLALAGEKNPFTDDHRRRMSFGQRRLPEDMPVGTNVRRQRRRGGRQARSTGTAKLRPVGGRQRLES